MAVPACRRSGGELLPFNCPQPTTIGTPVGAAGRHRAVRVRAAPGRRVWTPPIGSGCRRVGPGAGDLAEQGPDVARAWLRRTAPATPGQHDERQAQQTAWPDQGQQQHGKRHHTHCAAPAPALAYSRPPRRSRNRTHTSCAERRRSGLAGGPRRSLSAFAIAAAWSLCRPQRPSRPRCACAWPCGPNPPVGAPARRPGPGPRRPSGLRSPPPAQRRDEPRRPGPPSLRLAKSTDRCSSHAAPRSAARRRSLQ